MSWRSVIVSKDLLHGVGVFFFSVDASFVDAMFASTLESDVASWFGLSSLTTLARLLLSTVFWIPSWSILAYSNPILMTR